jgi:hypothetical protein
VDGCTRSKRPTSKSKGRGFGIRDDKMREHVRTVHEKAGKRKRDAVESAGAGEKEGDGEDDERFSAGSGDAEERVVKKVRSDDVYEGVAWSGVSRY